MMLTLWEWKNVHEPPAPVSPIVPGGMVVTPTQEQTKYPPGNQQQYHGYKKNNEHLHGKEQGKFGSKISDSRDKQRRHRTNKAGGCVLIDSPRDEGIQYRKELFDYQARNRGRFSRDMLPITPQRNFRCKHPAGMNVSISDNRNTIPTVMSYDHSLYLENGDYRDKVEKMKRVYELMQGVDRKYSNLRSAASVRTNTATASAKTPPKKSVHDSADSGFDSDVDKSLLNTTVPETSPDSLKSHALHDSKKGMNTETEIVPQAQEQRSSDKLNTEKGDTVEPSLKSPHTAEKLPNIKRSKSKKRAKTKMDQSEEMPCHTTQEAVHLPYVTLPSLEAVRAGKPNPGGVSAFSLIDDKSYSKFARKSKPKKSHLGQAVQEMRPVYDRLMPVDSQKMATVSTLFKKSSKKKTS
ncbi:uncharacterized protein LOC106165938 [Lingula anatina]|uniref:Uncharacterized protein LOC106165938 n=1 Tax=Lingula anatina TaxID=7574 RepID=A0A1S3IQD8_LINAN|nr:uncharacterized protein LOC106165938 [Lingula anatina]XP_013399754.1 uncharacterized protein LOC106165938 [Lingula anatina]|eukprot:XP_013399753.1 uncharacterized protein LOC106165938 [Lingula anatina]